MAAPDEALTFDQGVDSLLGQTAEPVSDPQPDPAEQAEGEPSAPEAEFEEVPVDDEAESSVDSEVEQSEVPEEEDAELSYTVKVNGKEEDVPLHVLIQRYQLQKSLDEGFKDLNSQRETVTQQLSDYQQGLQETQEARQRYLQIIEETQSRLGSLDDFPEPPTELRESDPYRYQEMRLARIEHQTRLQQLQQERQRVENEQAETDRKQFAQRIETEKTRMVQKIPEWQDEQVANREKSEIAQFAMHELGFRPEELQNAADHRVIVTLRYAKLYHDLMNNQDSIVKKKVRQKAPVVKSSSGMKPKPKSDAQKAFERFEATNKRFESGDPHADPVLGAVDYLLAKKPNQRR